MNWQRRLRLSSQRDGRKTKKVQHHRRPELPRSCIIQGQKSAPGPGNTSDGSTEWNGETEAHLEYIKEMVKNKTCKLQVEATETFFVWGNRDMESSSSMGNGNGLGQGMVFYPSFSTSVLPSIELCVLSILHPYWLNDRCVEGQILVICHKRDTGNKINQHCQQEALEF